MVTIKTTIWSNDQGKTVLVAEQPGLPSPIPKRGQSVFMPGFGDTVCTGITTSGSDKEVVEVQLTIR